jgi:hypothetical protein
VGGDGVAGSNIIGVAGAGDSTITASNDSGFAKGIGGDVENVSNITGDNGPDLNVYGSDVNVTSIAQGTAIVSQTASPTVTLALTAGGSSTVSGTATGVNVSTGNNATLSGSAPISQSAVAITNPTAIATSGIGPGAVSLNSAAIGTAAIGQSATPNLSSPLSLFSFASGPGGSFGSTTVGALILGSSPVAQTAVVISNPTSAATSP